jgi:signal transduction histidine kinase
LKERRSAEVPIGINTTNALASATFAFVGIGCAFFAFRDVVPESLMRLWFWPASAMLAFWFCSAALFAARKPDAAERAGVWAKTAIVLQYGTWIIVLGIIWILMPFGTQSMQFTTMLFSTCYIAGSFMSSVEDMWSARLRVVGTLGSLALVAVMLRMEFWPYLLVFLATFGIFMIVLNQMVASGIAELQVARDAAEASRDARTRFLASASHDLGQPLQAARLFFDQALRGGEPQKREKAAADARNALGSMERLLRQMLDHLRLEAGTVTVRVADVSVGSLIGKVASQFEPVAAMAGVSLIAVPSRLKVTGDADLIERALGNLVDNALRHAHSKRVLIGALRNRNRVRFWVIDDGAGVAKADLPSLFEDFVQGSDHGDDERGGFGLGLASVRRFAGLMGGYAGLEGKWQKGSAFFLDLPAGGALALH